jgi:subtilisin family serine protease
MLVVCSAGNEGNDPWKRISAPSDGLNVLSVGAVDTSGMIAAFSSIGPTSDARIKPDVVAVGFKTAIFVPGAFVSEGYGTSYASPQVAGMAACLWQAFPEKSNGEILSAIRRSSSRYFQPDNQYGYGIPDFLGAFWILSNADSLAASHTILTYPNPFTSDFEISFNLLDEPVSSVEIFNLRGEKQITVSGTWNDGDVLRVEKMSNSDPGVYILIMRSQTRNYVARIVRT